MSVFRFIFQTHLDFFLVLSHLESIDFVKY